MPPQKKGNSNLAFRLLLLTGYLFLFATPFNSRFYSIANFYVYGGTHARQYKIDKIQQQTGIHLSLDKRFQVEGIVRTSFPGRQAVPVYKVIGQKFYAGAPVYSTSDLPINALRGPPCA